MVIDCRLSKTWRNVNANFTQRLKKINTLTLCAVSIFFTWLLDILNNPQLINIHISFASTWHSSLSFFTFFTLLIRKKDFHGVF